MFIKMSLLTNIFLYCLHCLDENFSSKEPDDHFTSANLKRNPQKYPYEK